MNTLDEDRQDLLARFSAIATLLAKEPGVTLGSQAKKGFGASALQVNGKIFAMIDSKGCFVVKIPKARVDALENSGTGKRFDAGKGRPMKEWLSLDLKSEKSWLALAREAMGFVRG